MTRVSMFLAALLASVQPAAASPQRGGQAEAAEAVRLAADHIRQDYVDPSAADTIARTLLREAPKKQGDALAEDLTDLLRSASGDPHFRFGYSAEPLPPDVFDARTGGDEKAAHERTARINNFGVLRAERMRGNIGLLDLDQFTDPDLMRAPLAAAMELLKHCDALIIDLRYNGGGHARGAALVASYVLPEQPPRLLVTFETRKPGDSLSISTEQALEGPRFLDRPVYVLTGPKTFSAAELLASALQDAHRATVVGSRTRGGANPSARVWLTPHYAMILPTTRGVRPGGKSYEGVGLAPDIQAEEKYALDEARKAALSALLASKPGDIFADEWRDTLRSLQAASTPANHEHGKAAQ